MTYPSPHSFIILHHQAHTLARMPIYPFSKFQVCAHIIVNYRNYRITCSVDLQDLQRTETLYYLENISPSPLPPALRTPVSLSAFMNLFKILYVSEIISQCLHTLKIKLHTSNIYHFYLPILLL